MSLSRGGIEDHLVTNPEQVGEVLKGVRRELGLSQAQVGQRIGLPQKEVSRMENGSGRTTVERFFLFLSALELEIVIRPRNAGSDLEGEW